MDLIRKLCVILLINFVYEVSMLNICNKKIIKNIYELCPPSDNILEKISSMGCVTYYSAPKKDVTPGVKCVTTVVEPPIDKCSYVQTTYYFDNTTTPPRHRDYKQYDEGCGHVREVDSCNNVFQIYFVKVIDYRVACYYRCVDIPVADGWDFAAIAVAIGTQDDPEVINAVADCKQKLKSVGYTEELVDITTCREY